MSDHCSSAALARLAAFELGATERRTVLDHLALCSTCRRELTALDPSALFSLLESVTPDPALPYFGAGTQPEAFAPPAGPIRRDRHGRTGWVLATAAAAAALISLVVLQRPPLVAPEAGHGRHPAVGVDLAGSKSTEPLRQIVTRASDPAARIVTIFPSDRSRPTVTLILNDEAGL